MALADLRMASARILLFALSLLAGSIPATAAHAQEIRNIAQATWLDDGVGMTSTSNEVIVSRVVTPVALTVFRPQSGSLGKWENVVESCGGNVMNAAAKGSPGAPPAESDRIKPGEPILFELDAPIENRDPNERDVVRAEIVGADGDTESLLVQETGPNSGIFRGFIKTVATPPAVVSGNCVLSVNAKTKLQITTIDEVTKRPLAWTEVSVLADPYGVVFDSYDGRPIDGARVTIVDAASGQPAPVFGDDQVTSYPSTVISGTSTTDAGGNLYQSGPGEYRFPFLAEGEYRIVVEPPSPYRSPSKASPAELASLLGRDGEPYTIVEGSFSDPFRLSGPAKVEIDLPADRDIDALRLEKQASRASALPGETLVYTLNVQNIDTIAARADAVLVDTPSRWLRIEPDSVKTDGSGPEPTITFNENGTQMSIDFGDIEPGGTRSVQYAATLRPTAPAGVAANLAVVTDGRGVTTRAMAGVRVEAETIASRMTIMGRVSAGGCSAGTRGVGVAGVRVMLEDGSFAITDADGRYHFEGVVPGTHVVQAHRQTLPDTLEFVDCQRSTRSAGKANSRFVEGQGGSLIVVDFVTEGDYAPVAASASEGTTAPLNDGTPIADATATSVADAASPTAAAEADKAIVDTWLAVGDGPADWLFPALDYNPSVPATRVAIRHRPDQKVELSVDGKPADRLTFEGTRSAPGNNYAVSHWRGITIEGESAKLVAVVRNADGSEATRLTREILFSASPAKAELVPELSNLVADGRTNPVIAVRITDRRGRPVHDGLTGQVVLSQPYQSASELEKARLNALAEGLNRASSNPAWRVEGDEGIALIELAPTMVSGAITLDFTFASAGNVRRTQKLEGWIVPGDMPWTLVGLAEAGIGSRDIADRMVGDGDFDSDLGDEARVAFYAKGRVLGENLLTIAYDSAKQRQQSRLLGAIDPNAYYTVFADGSDRRFDAASREKLYIRIESRVFNALYGDFQTDFDQTRLMRYHRTVTGVRAEARTGNLRGEAFGAKISSIFRRDEIQGQGISGPYRLSNRYVVPNSERVTIEIRDRYRPEILVESQALVRFVDYDLDLLTGTIQLKQPLLSRDAFLNPQFLVVSYEVEDGTGDGELNAGARVEWQSASGNVRVGTSVITDKGDSSRTDMVGVDMRAKIGENTEVRAEAAGSRQAGEDSIGWLVEAEHNDEKLDLLAYVRRLEEGFGVGQQNDVELGRFKAGVDARYRVSKAVEVNATGWYDEGIETGNSRRAVQIGGLYRHKDSDARLRLSHFSDQLSDGDDAQSTVLEAGVAHRLLNNRLQLEASGSIALSATESIDLPNRYTLGARYALTPQITIIGSHEWAKGDAIDARTFRVGAETSLWTGGRAQAFLGQQQAENGQRAFASYGLSQSIQLSSALTVDFTLDGNRTLSGGDVSDIVNVEHPVASGGHLGQDGALFEDFTAVTAGAAYRSGKWSANVRAEYRNGEFAERMGATFGAIRQLDDGIVMGAGLNWTRATSETGAKTEIFDGAISAAYRPKGSDFAALAKLELRSDRVAGGTPGVDGAEGRTAVDFSSDALSRRIIGSLSTNWSPDGNRDEDEPGAHQRMEIGLFGAVRHNLDRVSDYDLSGTTAMGGFDLRIGIGERFEVGGSANVRARLENGTTDYSFGPQVGFSPTDDVLLSVGYNVTGFRDPDFQDLRSTRDGVYASIKIKFDEGLLSTLGIAKRR